MARSRVNIYKLECSNVGCDVVRCSPYVPGFENHPDIKVEEYIAVKLDRELAEKMAEALNDAFNRGREYATWR